MLVWLSSAAASNSRFLLLDRDGIINENRPDYVKSVQEIHLFPDALQALALLHGKGVGVVLVSNQSGLNRGIITWDDFWDMHFEVVRIVEQKGGAILAAFYCPHRPDENCECRKPAPAMLLEACRFLCAEPGETIFIGDQDSDIEAAKNAACRGVRVYREAVDPGQGPGKAGAPVFPTLLDAVWAVYGK